MSRKKKPLPLWENVTIEDIAAEGKAIAHVNGLVVFVPFAVPGDVVDLQVRRKKHSFAEAEVVRYHKLSEKRATAFCPHFGVCGGCKWQILPYEEQLKYKQKQVSDQLTRIGGVALPEISPILGSIHTREYRNKLEFGCSDKRWLTNEEVASGVKFDDMNAIGFHIPGAFDKILDISECHLMDPINNRIRSAARQIAKELGLTLYNARSGEGMLRGLMLRNSATTEIMLLIQFSLHSDDEQALVMQFMEAMKNTFPEITSLLYVNNTKCNDVIYDLPVHVYAGTDHIYETMEGLRFKVGPKSFYQTNTEQAYELYKVARNLAGLTGDELVYDLYTGTGTIANFVARSARQVIGIEYVPEAIEDAKVNAEINGIDNTLFFAGDMKDILDRDFIEQYGRPDVVITDPPRAGMHTDVIDTLLFAAPRRIVYVSCNPATQARDLALLSSNYSVSIVQPVDMFPHTHHVENVVRLDRIEQ